MCKNLNISVSIKKLEFEKRGYLSIYLEDGRILLLPLKDYPEIKKLNSKKRENWRILDNQFFTFIDAAPIYYIGDLMKC